MLKIAITGNIASGKSVVEGILRQQGFKVLDTDVVGHEILSSCNEVKVAFADYDVFDNGTISREKLGRVVFSDKKLLERLNSIVHPKIRSVIEEFFVSNISEDKVFVSVPLLFEADMSDMFDKIVFVSADDSIRLERLIKRNGFSKEYAQQRIDSQMPQEDKIKKSDFVIINNGNLLELEKQVYAILKS